MNEDLLRKNIANNIAHYRKQAGLTQSQLSERINYSDKSVSKWERAEGVPDVVVLTELAELFGVTVNELIYSGVKEDGGKVRTKSRAYITLLSAGIPWLVASIAYFVVRTLLPDFDFAINFFVYAIAVSGIVATVFTTLWFSHFYQFLSISMIVWGIAVSIHMSIAGTVNVYFIAIVMQALSILWYARKSICKKRAS